MSAHRRQSGWSVHQPADDSACTCPDCGKGMPTLGEDVTEVLDYGAGHFQVIRHVRPKYSSTACDAITQAPAMPTPRGLATPATLAHVLVSKFCNHLPLYRQSEIYAREGLELDRSTLGDWVGPGHIRGAAYSAGPDAAGRSGQDDGDSRRSAPGGDHPHQRRASAQHGRAGPYCCRVCWNRIPS